MKEHLALLGFTVKDVVTGFEGTVTSISFDVSGCVQGLVNAGVDKNGKPGESYWFDSKRLNKTSRKSVMKVPQFDIVPGGQSLPIHASQPKQ